MKKISSIVAGLVLSVSFANADFLSVSAGAGYEQQNIDGYVKVGSTVNYFAPHKVNPAQNVGTFGLKDENNPYVWVKFIHPIPLIPNVKLQYTKYDSDGHSNYIAGGNIEIFGDVKIPTGISNASVTQTVDAYDLTLFYEFKPIFADIEAGVGVDYWKGHTKIYGTAAGMTKTWVDNDWEVPLPYVYGSLETIPFYGFSLLGYAKVAKLGDNHHYEYMGAVKYTFDIFGPVNPFIKVGYKYKEAYGVDGDNETKLQYEGAFAEIGAKF